MGGIYDEALARRYIGLGARLVLGANDHSLILNAATQRAAFLRGIPLELEGT
jgi:2-keto-3-deoxy-L-rhamnonate aldolase RhmA